MGFNTVAMLLNDHMHVLVESPKTLAWALCHPPHSHREIEERSWNQQVRSVAEEAGERPIFFGNDAHILPTFHADDVHFLYAGRNTLERLKFHKFGTAKVDVWEKVPGGLEKRALTPRTVNTVTLILPDWWSRR